MKKTICLVCLACLCLSGAAIHAAEPPALFAPEPPDPAAASLLETYLSFLAQGDLNAALALQDLRGMRQYLLDRRLAELKAKTPELTDADLQELSAQIQLNDLAPARLQHILLGILNEANYPGMTWTIRGYARAPDDIDGYLASIESRSATGKDKPILVGLIKLGDEWRISPSVVEEIMARRATVHVGPTIAPPPEVVALANAFWSRFQTGDLDTIYADMSAAYRARVPLLTFLTHAQAFLDTVGLPAQWTFVRAITTQPQVLFVGVQVQGAKLLQPTLMGFRKTGVTWTIDDIQFEMPHAAAPPTAPTPPPAPARPTQPDLTPDLTPSL
ncbi:MAG: hypothetical protein PHO14_10565 [Kiritimatiellae bacterium]|jgi:hypothetical protein|nr:hypothetical protein [Kiritimatiellia bacterium]MDD4342656.1 hypothetical protein [Kiritimatiellia bacterium]